MKEIKTVLIRTTIFTQTQASMHSLKFIQIHTHKHTYIYSVQSALRMVCFRALGEMPKLLELPVFTS